MNATKMRAVISNADDGIRENELQTIKHQYDESILKTKNVFSKTYFPQTP